MVFELKRTHLFTKQFNKLPKDIQERFEKQFERLIENPFVMGKNISKGWLRELKNRCYRAYYVIFENEIIITLVAVSNKNDQQETVEFIKANFINFKINYSKNGQKTKKSEDRE